MLVPRRAFSAALPALLLSTRSPAAEPSAVDRIRLPAPSRTVAVGDLHGDCDAFVNVLRTAGLVDATARWTGGDAVLVQCGDVLDRGPQEAECLALLRSLKMQAAAAGGRVVTLLGNHEVLNACGVTSFVSEAGATAFGEPRSLAFRPGGALARELAGWPVVCVVGDTCFVHAGLTPEVATPIRAAAANTAAARWLSGDEPLPPPLLLPSAVGGRSPVWTRELGVAAPAGDACDEVGSALTALGASRLVVGHTVQEGINAACDRRVWRIDVGLSRAMGGGAPQALEVRRDGSVVRLGGGGGGAGEAGRGQGRVRRPAHEAGEGGAPQGGAREALCGRAGGGCRRAVAPGRARARESSSRGGGGGRAARQGRARGRSGQGARGRARGAEPAARGGDRQQAGGGGRGARRGLRPRLCRDDGGAARRGRGRGEGHGFVRRALVVR
mmetsp:Transcript_22415/g.73158  ORF Transcript_22415/g.73158 Transcript_22415/m.73158 type:complete len:442 (-) Transcript_22415:533-1858(-)